MKAPKKQRRPGGAVQARDLLQRITDFRQSLLDWHDSLTRKSEDPRLQFLLSYVREHERAVDRCIAEYTTAGERGLLNTWIPFLSDRSLLEDVMHEDDLTSDLDAEQVLERTLRVEQSLILLYRALSTNSLVPPRLREMFGALLKMEEHKQRRYARVCLDL